MWFPGTGKSLESRTIEILHHAIFFYSENINDLEMSLQVAEAEEKSATTRLSSPESKLKYAELVKSDMAIVDKYQEEIISLEKQLDAVEEKMPATGGWWNFGWNLLWVEIHWKLAWKIPDLSDH